ncbi:ABC transporter permease [Chloroflexota bacterium]
MSNFFSALWAETLKARRSKAPLLTVILFSLFPLVSGLFMIIIRDPAAAQSMGVISMKAQIVAGEGNWQTFYEVIFQAIALGGYFLFAFMTAWVFGREYADRTAKEWMALPAPRSAVVGAKFVLTAFWILGLTMFVFVIGLGVGMAIDIPGWSTGLAWAALGRLLTLSALNYMLMPFVALFASAGRGYLPALGWAFFSFIIAQIISVLGWGDWFPWSVPVLLSGMFGPQGVEQIGLHSYLLVSLAFAAGIASTFTWVLRADQA